MESRLMKRIIVAMQGIKLLTQRILSWVHLIMVALAVNQGLVPVTPRK